jgi:hypothetical protein
VSEPGGIEAAASVPRPVPLRRNKGFRMLWSVIEGGANTIFNPAATAVLPGIVPDGQLEEAWAATEARTSGAGLAGPALGGILFGLGWAVPFLTDAVSYAVSFGTVSRIRGRFRPENAAGRKALWREVADL